MSIGPATHLPLAILRTLAYSDVFDYPLRTVEIWRYLEETPATLDQVQAGLEQLVPDRLERAQGYYTLRGRLGLVDLRRQRQEHAARLWPHALGYGRQLAALPFVRHVSLTGALAVGNTIPGADVDYLVVTAPGRVWITRLLALLVVRLAARRGLTLCPNYLISENALVLAERGLYPARELAQMLPLSGLDVYQRLRACNPWVNALLPNAAGFIFPEFTAQSAEQAESMLNKFAIPARNVLKNSGETLLSLPPFDTIEEWEMNRKQRKFARLHPDTQESAFGPDWCKGHFDGHAGRTQRAFEQRLQQLEALQPAVV